MGVVVPRTEAWGTNPPKCGAKKKNRLETGDTCGLTAGFGTDHIGFGSCKFHGGSTPTGVSSANKARIQRRLRAAYGDLVEIDPGEALVQEVHRAQGVVTWIAAVVAKFTEVNLDDLDEKDARDKILHQSIFGYEAQAWVDLFYKERRHLAGVAKMALDAGVAARAISIEEEKLQLVADAINRIFGDLDLSVEQRAAFPGIARRHLALLAGPAPTPSAPSAPSIGA